MPRIPGSGRWMSQREASRNDFILKLYDENKRLKIENKQLKTVRDEAAEVLRFAGIEFGSEKFRQIVENVKWQNARNNHSPDTGNINAE